MGRINPQFARFALVGASNTAVHGAVYLSLWLVLPYLVAHVLATVVATACSYLLNCRFTFGVAPNPRSMLWFPLSNLALLGASTVSMAIAVTIFGVDERLAPLAGVALVPASFLATRAALSQSRGSLRQWRGAAVVAGVTALLGMLPLLVNRSFYFTDDSAAQFLPMWHLLGQRLLTGQWSWGLELGSWMGGDLAAESLFGIWNPVNLADFVLVRLIGDLAVAAAVVKIQFLVLLAVGTYVLCREHGAKPGPASMVAVALPFSGFVLYFEAASWAGGLIGLAWLPWVWWALRRYLHDRARALLPFVLGYLCVTTGDPYALLGLSAVFVVLAVEFGPRRVAAPIIAILACLPLVYWPLLASAGVGWRHGRELFNSGLLVPGMGDLLNASLPGFLPHIRSFGQERMTVPAMYFAWFALPVLPWLNWRAVPWRRCAGAIAVAGWYCVLCLGPSNVWMFRWPLRHVAVLYLAVSVLLAVALSHGLAQDRLRLRGMLTGIILLTSGYLAFAAWPAQAPRHLLSLAVVAALMTVVVRLPRGLVAMTHVGTAAVLGLQLLWFPVNRDIADYRFPTDIAGVREQYADLQGGTVLQIADRERIPPSQIADGSAWSSLLLGNMPAAVGLSSLVSYTGIGNDALHRSLCLNYYGATCPQAYDRVWDGLADRLKLSHIVVQRRLREITAAPPGWRVARRDREVVVLERATPLPWPHGTLSETRGVRVLSDVQQGTRTETLRVAGAGELVFARLAWPGYRVTVNGDEVAARADEAGLLSVQVPAGGLVRLSWSPPGVQVGLLLVLAALVWSTVRSVRSR